MPYIGFVMGLFLLSVIIAVRVCVESFYSLIPLLGAMGANITQQ